MPACLVTLANAKSAAHLGEQRVPRRRWLHGHDRRTIIFVCFLGHPPGRSLGTAFRVNARAACDGWPGGSEWAHLTPLAGRLNHGSFGAAPVSVLAAQDELRRSWIAHADSYYFSGCLDEELIAATAAAATASGACPSRTVLVENASVAVAIVAQRWAWALREGSGGARPGDAVAVLEWRCVAVRRVAAPGGALALAASQPYQAAAPPNAAARPYSPLAARLYRALHLCVASAVTPGNTRPGTERWRALWRRAWYAPALGSSKSRCPFRSHSMTPPLRPPCSRRLRW